MSAPQPLTLVAKGAVATVAQINVPPASRARLMEMGLLVGTKVELVRFAPMGDPVEIKVRGYNLTLRKVKRSKFWSIQISQGQQSNGAFPQVGDGFSQTAAHFKPPKSDKYNRFRSVFGNMNSAAASEQKKAGKASPAAYVVLTGNPNCGKTTLFNALTGLRAKVGNYAGVTVERKEGKLLGAPANSNIHVLDLPGTYSLSPNSLDEQISRDVLLNRLPELPPPDLIVVVVDASNLQRNLYYATQVVELGHSTIIALNMVDVAEAQWTSHRRAEAFGIARSACDADCREQRDGLTGTARKNRRHD